MERSGWYNNWFCPNEKPEDGLNDNKEDDTEKKSKASKAQNEGG